MCASLRRLAHRRGSNFAASAGLRRPCLWPHAANTGLCRCERFCAVLEISDGRYVHVPGVSAVLWDAIDVPSSGRYCNAGDPSPNSWPARLQLACRMTTVTWFHERSMPSLSTSLHSTPCNALASLRLCTCHELSSAPLLPTPRSLVANIALNPFRQRQTEPRKHRQISVS